MSQPVNFARFGINDKAVYCSEPSNHDFPPFSQPAPEAQPSDQGRNSGGGTPQDFYQHQSGGETGPEVPETMESLSTFWDQHRGQAYANHLVHNFKMEWMWNQQEEQVSSMGNHALQDYQMQLMLLEQQNKKRLMIARSGLSTPPCVPALAQSDNQSNFSPIREVQSRERIYQEYRNSQADMQPPICPRAMRCLDLKANHKKSSPFKTLGGGKLSESFPQFSKLSAELRVKIWTFASLTPRIVELYICFPHQGVVTSPTKPPAVLHSHCNGRSPPNGKSQELENEINATQSIFFNPSVDTIYVGEATWHRDLNTFLTTLPPNEALKIEALAVPLRLAESSKLECIDSLPALRELIYVTPVPHQFCILLRYRDLWFEDLGNPPAFESLGRRRGLKKGGVKVGNERQLKGGIATRARRKEAWLLREGVNGAKGGEGGTVTKGNFAETFWMKLVGPRERQSNAEAEEEAWMPPGSCEYCKVHREAKALALMEARN